MGKRNVRIRRSELLQRLPELSGKEVHVVLLEGRTYFGRVTEIHADGLTIQDPNARWTNRKRHTHRLHQKDILEIIFDLVTDY